MYIQYICGWLFHIPDNIYNDSSFSHLIAYSYLELYHLIVIIVNCVLGYLSYKLGGFMENLGDFSLNEVLRWILHL